MNEDAYCPGCNRSIRLVTTRDHGDAHANLPDGAQLVCLDFGAGCTDGRCPVTGALGLVMGVRLARSHLNDEGFETVTARCCACESVADMEVLDREYVFCPVCETTSRWVALEVDGAERITLTLD
ncbi:MAG TPA: hypothetical protein VK837_08750 [Longimicrobiales bacterium]|nr:hypothetical protein [Longimicrobiales bacterium]